MLRFVVSHLSKRSVASHCSSHHNRQ